MSDDPLGPELQNRLRAELDRVQPRFSSPRYLKSQPRPLAWRFAPAALVASVISMLALSAYVATGSPNPADWGHEVVTIIQTGSTTPTPTVHPTLTPTPTPAEPTEKPSQEPNEHESPEPTEPAEHQSPEPSGDASGGSSSHDGGGSDGGGSDSGDSHSGSTSDSD